MRTKFTEAFDDPLSICREDRIKNDLFDAPKGEEWNKIDVVSGDSPYRVKRGRPEVHWSVESYKNILAYCDRALQWSDDKSLIRNFTAYENVPQAQLQYADVSKLSRRLF